MKVAHCDASRLALPVKWEMELRAVHGLSGELSLGKTVNICRMSKSDVLFAWPVINGLVALVVLEFG